MKYNFSKRNVFLIKKLLLKMIHWFKWN